MRLIPVFFSVMLGAILLVVVSHAFAEEGSSNSEQYEPLDDEALEKEYGIKAGAVQRDAPPSDAEPGSDAVSGEGGDDTDTEGGTGGTGSADDAVENGEDEQSRKDNNG